MKGNHEVYNTYPLDYFNSLEKEYGSGHNFGPSHKRKWPDIKVTVGKYHGTPVKVGIRSTRMKVLIQNPKCVCCGFKGTYWSVEREWSGKNPPNDIGWHANMYGLYHNVPIMLTHDHKIPKSVGGSNGVNNGQTLCTICNGLKGNDTKMTWLKLRLLHHFYIKMKFPPVMSKNRCKRYFAFYKAMSNWVRTWPSIGKAI